MKTYPGYIYLAFNPTENLHKIGRSQNPEKRMSSLKANWGSTWNLIHVFQADNIRVWESYIIDVFWLYSYQVTAESREYFELPIEAVQFFTGLVGHFDYLPKDAYWDYSNPFSHPSWHIKGLAS